MSKQLSKLCMSPNGFVMRFEGLDHFFGLNIPNSNFTFFGGNDHKNIYVNFHKNFHVTPA